MSERTLAVQHLSRQMIAAFHRGDVIDAQNINTFLASVERMTDQEYAEMAADAEAPAEPTTSVL